MEWHNGTYASGVCPYEQLTADIKLCMCYELQRMYHS